MAYGSSRVDPKTTETFLLTQEEVLDASAWFDGDALLAHVTPIPGIRLDVPRLLDRCVVHIGEAHSPREILVITPR